MGQEATSQIGLGMVEPPGQGKLQEAMQRYQDSLAIRQKLTEAGPTDLVWQADLSASYQKAGNILGAQGKLNEAMKDAMRARDTAALGTIRMILAKLKEVDIASRTEANREGVADDKILSMMQGMIKQRNESITLYEKGNRADLADKEKAEIGVIERFLPQQMDEAAVEAAVKEAVASSGAKSIKDMGGVMAALKAKYAGQMDFAKASAVVKKTLAG